MHLAVLLYPCSTSKWEGCRSCPCVLFPLERLRGRGPSTSLGSINMDSLSWSLLSPFLFRPLPLPYPSSLLPLLLPFSLESNCFVCWVRSLLLRGVSFLPRDSSLRGFHCLRSAFYCYFILPCSYQLFFLWRRLALSHIFELREWAGGTLWLRRRGSLLSARKIEPRENLLSRYGSFALHLERGSDRPFFCSIRIQRHHIFIWIRISWLL